MSITICFLITVQWLQLILVNNYGISKDRFIVKYSGEKVNLIGAAGTETDHLQNRRVQFSVAKKDDFPMDRPKGDGGANRNWKY